VSERSVDHRPGESPEEGDARVAFALLEESPDGVAPSIERVSHDARPRGRVRMRVVGPLLTSSRKSSTGRPWDLGDPGIERGQASRMRPQTTLDDSSLLVIAVDHRPTVARWGQQQIGLSALFSGEIGRIEYTDLQVF